MRYKQAVIEYSLKHGVTRAAIRYKNSRQNIYRWRKKYDGTVRSLANGSHRPHSHPKQHTEEEISLVKNMRRRNPHAGLVVFWVKLRQRGYTRSISGLYRLLCRIDGQPIKLPNPKYIAKSYEKMTYPGQRVQIDVKYVPSACLAGEAAEEKFYQYTFIDEYSRFRYLEAFKEQSTYSSTQFLKHVVEKFPFAIECVQTDNGFEFTNEMSSSKKKSLTLFEETLARLGIRHKRSDRSHQGTTARWNAAIAKTMNTSMLHISSIPSRIFPDSSLSGKDSTTIFPCVLSTGSRLRLSYFLSLMCNTSLTNLQKRYGASPVR